MAGKAARRARRQELDDELEDDELVDADLLDEEVGDDAMVRPSLASRFVTWADQSGRVGSASRMEGRDAAVVYAGAAILTIVPLAFIVGNATHHGHALASPVFQGAGLIVGLLTALSVQLANRVVTPLAAIISVLLTGAQSSAIPSSLDTLSELDLVAGMGLVIYLTLRQSKARGNQNLDRRSARQQTRASRGSGRRRASKEPEPTGPAASRRYTPPKNRSA